MEQDSAWLLKSLRDRKLNNKRREIELLKLEIEIAKLQKELGEIKKWTKEK